MNRHASSRGGPWPAGNPHELEEEIRLIEERLARLGPDGDCAYERALSQAYGSLLELRRSALAAMRAAGL